ncbi:DUF1622 domain-containing protein [Methanoplanus sp. FWC-SCC4]|uniref:DUF1622 domain-containing protein n=1 Tax=Methanochimaera problematica TaxID=2609417 RepID=A0AA97I3I5_9EURY|nr:DUF1622 domain-containing protein [Methanoplanus sp. FWC-SCC4]WOF16753.1 DUF1622 domain-containing protein [Methanoplanus sp. FWC-SCC4]
MDFPLLLEIARIFSYFFEFIGAALIVYGGLKATIKVILLELRRKDYIYNQIRIEFTGKIVFGLEFLIAADLLATLMTPTLEELGILASVVVIRTILGYFLSKEATEFKLE